MNSQDTTNATPPSRYATSIYVNKAEARLRQGPRTCDELVKEIKYPRTASDLYAELSRSQRLIPPDFPGGAWMHKTWMEAVE